jgi:hypothetical protein
MLIDEFVITNKKEPKLEEEQDYALTKQKPLFMPFLVPIYLYFSIELLAIEGQETSLV